LIINRPNEQLILNFNYYRLTARPNHGLYPVLLRTAHGGQYMCYTHLLSVRGY